MYGGEKGTLQKDFLTKWNANRRKVSIFLPLRGNSTPLLKWLPSSTVPREEKSTKKSSKEDPSLGPGQTFKRKKKKKRAFAFPRHTIIHKRKGRSRRVHLSQFEEGKEGKKGAVLPEQRRQRSLVDQEEGYQGGGGENYF